MFICPASSAFSPSPLLRCDFKDRKRDFGLGVAKFWKDRFGKTFLELISFGGEAQRQEEREISVYKDGILNCFGLISFCGFGLSRVLGILSFSSSHMDV